MPAELAELHQHVYRDSSRERLMQSARALFVDGYHKTSTAAVARYAASSESQMVKHFGSKEGLLHAVFDLWWDDLLERINGGSGFSELPPRLRLDRVIDCMVDQFRFDQKVGRLMLLEGWRFQTAGEGPIMTEGFLRFRRILDDALKEASERGQLTSGVSPDIVRDALVGAAEGLVRNLLTAEYSEEEVVYSFDKVREILNTLTDSLVAPGSA